MPWLKTVGCDCPECGPDPCTAGCACTFHNIYVTAEGTVGIITEHASAGSNFIVSHSVDIEIQIDAGTLTFDLYADGVLIYSSGVITVGTTFGSATVPAGTATLTAVWVITVAIGAATIAIVECP